MRIRDNPWLLPREMVENVVEFPAYPNHDCIWSLTRGLNAKVYFGLGAEGRGDSARFMEHDPATGRTREIADMAVLTKDFLKPGKIPNSKLHFSLCVGKTGMIYGATHPTAPPPGEKMIDSFGTFGNPDCGHTGSFVFRYDPATDRIENLGLVAPWEGIRTMVMDREREILYCLTYPRVHLLAFELAGGKVTDHGRVAMTGSFDLLVDERGRVYGTNDAGNFYCFDPEKQAIVDLPLRTPGLPHRRSPYNFLWYPFHHPEDGRRLYGGTYYDGHLFRLDPAAPGEVTLEDLGYGWGPEPGPGECWAADYIQTPVFGRKNVLYYGFASIWEQVHLVGFDLDTGAKVDFGGISLAGMDSGFLSASAASPDRSRLYFADITMKGRARILVVRSTAEDFARALERQKAGGKRPAAAAAAPAVREEFDLQASEIMSVSEPFRRHAFPFVEEGRLALRELNFLGVSPAIPAGECAIKALAMGPGGRVYGVTGGRRAHLFLYDPYPLNDHVVDLGLIGGEESACGQMVWAGGRLYGGTAPDGRLFAYDPAGEYSIFWTSKPGTVEMLASPAPGDPVHALLPEAVEGRLYGLTRAGRLFAFEIAAGRCETLAEIEAPHLSPVLVRRCGRLYGARRNGEMFAWDLAAGKLSALPCKIPGGKGRDFQNSWRSAARGPNGEIAGGTEDGTLFLFDPAGPRLICLGRPVADSCIRALDFLPDGRLYGMAGAPGRICHLFCHDPRDRSMRDLGIPAVNFPKSWVGYEFDAMVSSPEGFLYLGESDRISHLFIYAPPVRAGGGGMEAS
ncbi:MAG: hypothetical protein V1809_16670 [Planctomycetota bacterium]